MADDTPVLAPKTGATSLDVGADNAVTPATVPGTPSASGNPGANNPGVGSLGSGGAGVVNTEGLPMKGVRDPDDVSNSQGNIAAAGGMGGTGTNDLGDEETEERERILANSGAPPK